MPQEHQEEPQTQQVPDYCMQMVMQPEMLQDPITGEQVITHTYVKPNCGGGKFHNELIDIRVKAKKGNLYHVVVKPHDKKVIKGIGSVRVLHNDDELVANSSNFGSESCIELDFTAENGMKVIVEIDWKYNIKAIWPPIIKEEVTINHHKEVHVEVRVK